MECWILFDGDIESSVAGAYETRRFIEAGRRQNINVRVIKSDQFDLVVTQNDRDSVLIDGQTAPLPDFLLPRMGSDTNYFGLAVIRHLERLGVQSFNSSEAIEAVIDKMHSQQILAENNLPVPNTMLAKFPVDSKLVEQTVGFPVVVKTLVGTQGSGVFLCEKPDNFNDLMELVGKTQPNMHLIFQEFIASSHGRDLRVFVIDGRVVAAMERRAKDGSFKANFSRGGEVRQFPLNREVERLAIESSRTLNLDIAGIDILFDKGGYKICEANSAPDFRGLESCCDISIADEIMTSIVDRLNRRPDEGLETFQRQLRSIIAAA